MSELNTHFNQLPLVDDIWLIIFDYLMNGYKDQNNLMLVSKKMKQLVESKLNTIQSLQIICNNDEYMVRQNSNYQLGKMICYYKNKTATELIEYFKNINHRYPNVKTVDIDLYIL